MSKSLVILGAGYTARYLLPLASHRYAHVLATSRVPEKHLSHITPNRRIRFDLTQQDTWKNIPTETDLLWCFPAVPLHLVQEFSATLDSPLRRLVVLGSTSAYDIGSSREYPPPWIDESAPINLTKPRVQGEEFLRINCGAMVLRVAGIYGPGRNPLDWIGSGRVGPSRKYVNLIHVDDLAAICLASLRQGAPGDVYNVSDGTPRTWEDICRITKERWGIRPASSELPTTSGKRILNNKMLILLQADHASLHHGDFARALEELPNRSVMPGAAPLPQDTQEDY
ncbi:MAG: hypothetical protein ACT4OL_02085 [Nitrospiraceae bacterium]